MYCNPSVCVLRVLQVCSVSHLRCCRFQLALTSNEAPVLLKVKMASGRILAFLCSIGDVAADPPAVLFVMLTFVPEA